MARRARIATLAGSRTMTVGPEATPESITNTMIEEWQNRFAKILPDTPDLIVVPEACDRPSNLTMDERLAYYRYRGNKIRDSFAETARRSGCYIIYSASRELEDGSWRNSSVLLGRDGEIVGIYNKNHLVIEETTQAGALCGNDAPVFTCDFGTVACAICFDLNFHELRDAYTAQHPDIILFSSMYHGGFVQRIWAYECRSYFVGAICGLPCEIRNPFGEVVASSTNYQDYIVANVNLDYQLAHLDYNREKFTELKKKYGKEVTLHDPGLIGSLLVTSESETVSAADMIQEFEIELLDDYMARARAHRASNLEPD